MKDSSPFTAVRRLHLSSRWLWRRAARSGKARLGVLARLLAYCRFLLCQRHRFRRLVLETVGDCPILVLPEVFNPKLLISGDRMARALNERLIPPGTRVLDMGTGSGVGAIFAARWAGRVTAVDVNPEAVRCARLNAWLNRAEDKLEILQGDLFAPVAQRRFDVVLFNPPYLYGAPRDLQDYAWHSTDTVARFAEQLPAHLAPGGYALVLFSTLGARASAVEVFLARNFTADKVSEFRGPGEIFSLCRLRPRKETA